MNVIALLLAYIVVINVIGFALMGIDKAKARKRAWRIPEATLFLIALVGGSLGTTVGMRVFRHKTLHWYFVFGMPAILIVQILLILFVIYGPINLIVL
ncbi:MAG: DUF1294 domain-containing protein [Lachnospiraceae bacterium]|nr:DUF1294 domain-containing protein [Clostridiales bacterium]MDY3108526.1 DUF1294 domain-containing protein [Lachnospiraceae bacterium]